MSKQRAPLNSSLALGRLRQLLAEHDTDSEEWRLPPERDLAASIGVGRRALRRAMEVLEAEGLIRRHQGRGTFSGTPPTLAQQIVRKLAEQTNPVEVMEVRLELEPALARLAAIRGTQEQISFLERLAQKTARADDDDSWELWDAAFHRQIAISAGNRLMVGLLDSVNVIRQDEIWRRLRASGRTPQSRDKLVQEHTEIVQAIAARDPLNAERAMRQHLVTISNGLQALMFGATLDDAEEKEKLRHAADI